MANMFVKYDVARARLDAEILRVHDGFNRHLPMSEMESLIAYKDAEWMRFSETLTEISARAQS